MVQHWVKVEIYFFTNTHQSLWHFTKLLLKKWIFIFGHAFAWQYSSIIKKSKSRHNELFLKNEKRGGTWVTAFFSSSFLMVKRATCSNFYFSSSSGIPCARLSLPENDQHKFRSSSHPKKNLFFLTRGNWFPFSFLFDYASLNTRWYQLQGKVFPIFLANCGKTYFSQSVNYDWKYGENEVTIFQVFSKIFHSLFIIIKLPHLTNRFKTL